MKEAEAVKTFLSVVSPGFVIDGELPSVRLEGIEVRNDGHAVAILHEQAEAIAHLRSGAASRTER